MLDIGEHQFLVLLFVMQPEFDYRRHGRILVALQEFVHLRIDVLAIRVDFGQTRPRNHAALGARMLVAHGVVVGIEQDLEMRIERTVSGEVRGQHKGLEKPAGVRQMPLGRAGIGHRLQRAVLRRQGFGEGERSLADLMKALGKVAAGGGPPIWPGGRQRRVRFLHGGPRWADSCGRPAANLLPARARQPRRRRRSRVGARPRTLRPRPHSIGSGCASWAASARESVGFRGIRPVRREAGRRFRARTRTRRRAGRGVCSVNCAALVVAANQRSGAAAASATRHAGQSRCTATDANSR